MKSLLISATVFEIKITDLQFSHLPAFSLLRKAL